MKSSEQKFQSWLRVRKDLYRQVRAHVEKRLGKNAAIETYQLDYAREFYKKWIPSKPKKLFQAMNKSQIILLADFHALSQSQKSHLRLLRGANIKGLKYLGMECFYEQDQRWIDRFLEGQISEQELLRMIRWTAKWGFPWGHYRQLVLWAAKNQIKVIALNRSYEREGLRALHDRDLLAAQRVAEILNEDPEARMVIVYGDLHISKDHLPFQIEKRVGSQVSVLRVFQNSEKIYFQLASRSLESQIDVVDLGKNTFCLNTIPPWVKWQNYLMYLEQDEDREIDDGETDLDLNDQVGQYVKVMAEELGFSYDLKKLSVFTAQESSLWNQLEDHLEPQFVKGYRLFIENEVSFFSPESEVAFLSRATVNHAATLAMHFLHAQMAGVKKWGFRGAQDFERLIWVIGFGYFGSKLINPKRKSDTLGDIKAAIAMKATSDYGKEALRLALAQKMNELIFMAQRRQPRLAVVPRKRISYLTAAELLGGLLGERLYNGYHQGELSILTLRNLMSEDWSCEDFSRTYLETMEMVESLPLAFKSKNDKL